MIDQENTSTEQLVDTIVEGIQEKKGTNIAILDMREIDGSICQYFIICDGDSNTHVDAIGNSVEDYVRKQINDKPFHIEGRENAEWILVDYVDVVVHIFQKPIRSFYNLEDLWADAKRTDIENLF
ncbi:ribosome silencing factor [Plebeiibacterium sediminum]|uniref:Ribosomal silencing factor RsfS n=1 Tax=Plebeiibacterium sediminum TaxID=2992112 RepID=A0AAE3M0P2_9BACT|nr:ribosome silencing factor [Plebeiobacterium sediminum]MCW3784964.1 ribosome silencing factor [Plebeiobacterium sediminum]